MMTPKKLLQSKSMCVVPWTGFILEPDGNIKNCVCSLKSLGNVNQTPMQEILTSPENLEVKQAMLDDIRHASCETCHRAEKDVSTFHDVVSSRIYYLKELKHVPMALYDKVDNFELHTADLRWRNTCNFACVYCFPIYSSKWSEELGIPAQMDTLPRQQTQQWVYDNIHTVDNLYLAGGEPILVKENIEVLKRLYQRNPGAVVRVNTNLSMVEGPVFDEICKFKNVHWIVSVETQGEEFNYIRYGGDWNVFEQNLEVLKKLNHKITFNMLYFVLNHRSVFDCVDYFRAQGFHDNSFVVWTLTGPSWLDARHLPDHCLDEAKKQVMARHEQSSHLLKHSYKIIYDHLCRPFDKDPTSVLLNLKTLDDRRGLDSKKIFPELYALLG